MTTQQHSYLDIVKNGLLNYKRNKNAQIKFISLSIIFIISISIFVIAEANFSNQETNSSGSNIIEDNSMVFTTLTNSNLGLENQSEIENNLEKIIEKNNPNEDISVIIEFTEESTIPFEIKKIKEINPKISISNISNIITKKLDRSLSVAQENTLNAEVNTQNQKIRTEQDDSVNQIKNLLKDNITVKTRYKDLMNGMVISIKRGDIDKIKNLSNVKGVWEDEIVHIQLQDSVPLINANKVWAMQNSSGSNITGEGITVAIIDTGIAHNHPDLGNCTTAQFLSGTCAKTKYGWDFANNDPDPTDDHGHGTHVAGIVGANGQLKGVAPNVTFLDYKVCDSGGGCLFSWMILALENATLKGANIVSISIGTNTMGYADNSMTTTIDNAVASGVIVVIAASNNGPSYSTIGSPGSTISAITVGASDKSNVISSFSSRGFNYYTNGTIAGIKPDVLAPGESINSTVQNFSCDVCWHERYITWSGTSMATPHISGVVALLKQAHPDWTPIQIKSAITNPAKDLGSDPLTQGSGRVDALASYNISAIIIPNNIFLGNISCGHLNYSVANYSCNMSNFSIIKIINISNFNKALSYNLSIKTPSGITATFNDTTFNLSINESRLVSINITINPSTAGMFIGSRFINLTMTSNESQTMRVPLALETETPAPPRISFIAPTPVSFFQTVNPNIEINISIVDVSNLSKLGTFIFTWNYTTNYIVYDNNLALMLNFDNRSSLGENSTLAADFSKLANNATCTGSFCPIWNSSGKYDGAYFFNGTRENYFTLRNRTVLTNYTLSAWIKLRGNGNGSFGTIFAEYADSKFGISNHSGTRTMDFYFTTNHFGNSNITLDTWNNVVLVKHQNGSFSFYLNGQFDGSGNGAPVMNLSWIGSDDTHHFFNGTMDNLFVWNRSLSEKEIIESYMSNFYKYNKTQWYFYVNQSLNVTIGLDPGVWFHLNGYQAFVTDSFGNSNLTEFRAIGRLDNCSPEFSTYWDNNGTLGYSGIGKFNVTVTSTNGTVLLEINGVNVTATNLTNNVYNASYTFNFAGTYPYRWISYGNGTFKNYDVSIQRNYTLNGTDLEYPKFSDYWDNNASQFVDGTGYFNVTVLNTNGTVILTYNNTNYTATNKSGDGTRFNVTLVGLTNGTYPYNWSSYGDGTLHHYNISNARSYTVNVSNPYPQFSGYWDNNGTQQTGGTGYFNVTVLDTNGTVILTYNNTNYTATNKSGNPAIFNVTILNLPLSGTFSYNWTSYGNGTSHFYNISNTRYYTVNNSEYPQFSGYWDNNGTKEGIGLFNVTISQTNGTVILTYNNVNYTASNKSGDATRFNVTILSLTNGTYPYNWSSYGDGPSMSYNISNARSYTANFSSVIFNCMNLTMPNTTYTLYSSISNDTITGDCINVMAQNITLDCLGYTIASIKNFTGIYSNKYNTTIQNCQISMGSVGNTNAIGIEMGNGANFSHVINNTIIGAMYYGISFLFGTDGPDNSTIENNNVSVQSDGAGIYLKVSSYNNLTNNLVTNNGTNGKGIYISSSANNILINNTGVSNSSYGTYIENSNNNTFDALRSEGYSTGSYGIVFSNSNNTVIKNCLNVSGVDGDVLYVTSGSSNNTFLNCSYNYSKETVMANSNLFRMWYYRAYVKDTNGNPLNNFNVTAFNSIETYMFNLTTGEDGYTPLYQIIDYYNNAGTRIYYSNYTIYADNISDFASHTFNASLSNNYQDNFTVENIDFYPQFSDYWDNNATKSDGGTGLFNVTLTGTNGSVYLTFNNTNYTATNNSGNPDVFNVTILNLVNRTYTYNWSSYGSGPSKFYNKSDIRSYTVDFIILVSDCMNLTSANTIYRLSSSISNDTITGDCINVNAQNITLDCMGFTIASIQNFTGVYSEQPNTKIQNCNVSMGSEGNANAIGIEILYPASYSHILNNIIIGGMKYGINLTAGYSIIENNTITTSNGTGIILDNANSSNVTSNIVSGKAGINLSKISNSIVTNNTVTFGSIHGISLFSSLNNTLTNNRVTGIFSLYPIYLLNSMSNVLINNTGIDGNTGIFISTNSHNVTLINNTGTGSSIGIRVFTGSANSTFINNRGVSITSFGFQIRSDDSTFINNTGISNSSYGFNLGISRRSTFTNTLGTSNYSNGTLVSGFTNSLVDGLTSIGYLIPSGGVAITNSINTLFKNSNFSGVSKDIFLYNAAGWLNITFINCSYDSSKEMVLGNGGFSRMWYYRAYVKDTNGNPINNANVTAFNITGDYMFNLTTGADGFTPMYAIMDYYINNSITTYYSNYMIYADNGVFSTNHPFNASLGNNLQDNFTLTSDPYPQFSNYWDNNATQFDGGIGYFNVTMLYTNGTVILTYNNTNYTATNTSGDATRFNVTILSLTNGTYPYNWSSYGDGPSMFYNLSDTRYYTVNNLGQCSPILNANWIISDTQICDGVEVTTGTGVIKITSGKLYLLGGANISTGGLVISTSGDKVFINRGSKLKINTGEKAIIV